MMRTGGGCVFHDADLHGRGVGAQQEPRLRDGRRGGGQVEGVLRIAGRMVGGGVQRVEAMVFVLDFGAVGDDEADLAEAADDILGDLRERMELAEGAAAAREREIGGFFGRGGRKFQFAVALGQGGFEFDLGGVDGLAGGGLFFFGQGAELFHQRGEFAVGARKFTRACSRAAKSGAARNSASAACFNGSIWSMNSPINEKRASRFGGRP